MLHLERKRQGKFQNRIETHIELLFFVSAVLTDFLRIVTVLPRPTQI